VSLWKRGKVFWSYVYVKGVRHYRSTGTGNRRQAELAELKFRQELEERLQRPSQRNPEMPFAHLAARFLADGIVRPYHVDRLKVLLPYFGEVPIGEITKRLTQDYRKQRHAQKAISEATVNRDMEALRHILFWAVDEGLLSSNPLARVPLIRERRKRRSVMSVEEETALLKAASPHLQRIIIAALDTGMRRGEILGQLWEYMDFPRRLLSVTKSKTPEGEAREIPLTERLFRMLSQGSKSQGLIFVFKDRPIHSIKTAWKATIKRSGVRHYRFHDLRHTFNTRLMEAGVMQEVRKALMGHSSGEDVHSMYTHVELPVKREAIRKLEEWMQEQARKAITGGKDDESESKSDVESHPQRLLPGS